MCVETRQGRIDPGEEACVIGKRLVVKNVLSEIDWLGKQCLVLGEKVQRECVFNNVFW